MKTSLKGIDLIKRFEGFKAYPYTCPAGKLTVGYDHVIDRKYHNMAKVTSPITKEQAYELLRTDVKLAEDTINNSVTAPLKQGQFDAISSLIYNWGSYNFKASQGLKNLNAKDYNGAANKFFSKENGVVIVRGKILEGLVKRRQAEFMLWSGVNE